MPNLRTLEKKLKEKYSNTDWNIELQPRVTDEKPTVTLSWIGGPKHQEIEKFVKSECKDTILKFDLKHRNEDGTIESPDSDKPNEKKKKKANDRKTQNRRDS